MNQHEKRHPQWEHTTQPQEAEKKVGGGGDLSLPHPTGIWSMKASNDYAVLMENLLITNIL